MMFIVWIVVAFGCGSLPFSVWVGRLALGKDIRAYGDGNPGATNVLRAGGKRLGALAAVLDSAKGLMPVGLAAFAAHFSGIELAAIALAPVLGHAFSPFLGFKGGKAVGVTFGIWIGLTIWEAPIVLGLMLAYWFQFVAISGWSVMLALGSLGLYLLLAHPDPALLLVLIGNMVILAWTHRSDLRQSFVFRKPIAHKISPSQPQSILR
ncbi:MAG: glycerol-3-phosphate acyltransferase [Anaerolineae bacterium]|nr:glycerol-3-phosphate acyltransferase [Anaerolineae bacterium]